MINQTGRGNQAQQTILIADDDTALAEAIAITLDEEGLHTVVAHDGERALALARQLKPDLILTDVMMPGKTGLEICTTLKQDPATASIPIILITAKAERHDRKAGLEAGANAYLTKPFSPTELIDLVNKALAGRPITPRQPELSLDAMPNDQLIVYARELRELVERERHQRRELETAHQRLGEVDRLKAAFLSAVTHELLTPFSTIGLPLQILQRQSESWTLAQQNALDDLATEIAGLHQLVRGVVKFAELMNKRREPQPGHYALSQIVPGAVRPIAALAEARQIDFRCLVSDELQVYVDPELLGEAVFQMAHNAVKFNAPGGRAQVTAFEAREWIVIEVSDTGVGLTSEQLTLLGEPFEQSVDSLRRGREGLGIGWAFVSYVAEVHGGRTRAESSGPDQGSTFSLALPAIDTESS